MKKIIYTLCTAMLIGITANAQTWRGKHNGLPSGFSTKSVYGDGTRIIVTNTSGTVGSQVYYTPDSTTPFAASPSTLGMFAPMESNIAKARGVLFAGSTVGLYKSDDNGQNWVHTSATGSMYQAYAHNDTVYVSTGAALNMSVDTGNTWTSTGYPGFLAVSILKSNGALFVGSTSDLRYTLDGSTWNTVSSPGSLTGTSIVSIVEFGGSIYAACNNGIYKSSDVGHSWTNILAQDMVSLIVVDTSLIGGTASHGVYQSDQAAATWSQINTGLPFTGIAAYNAVNSISYNDNYLICSAGGDSSIYVVGLGELGLHGGTDTTTDTTVTPPPTGITNTQEHATGFVLSPNPAADEITVETEATPGVTDLLIYDIAGRAVKHIAYANTAIVKVSLADVAAGTYFVALTKDRKNTVKKLVIIK